MNIQLILLFLVFLLVVAALIVNILTLKRTKLIDTTTQKQEVALLAVTKQQFETPQNSIVLPQEQGNGITWVRHTEKGQKYHRYFAAILIDGAKVPTMTELTQELQPGIYTILYKEHIFQHEKRSFFSLRYTPTTTSSKLLDPEYIYQKPLSEVQAW